MSFAVLLSGSALAQPEGHGNPAPAPQNPCIQPAPMVTVEDYTGPLRKLVLFVARKPEIKTVQRPSLAEGTICALRPGQKFHLFVRNTFEPVTIVASAFDAGIEQAQDTDPTFGQGFEGYGKRLGTAALDRVSSDFFHTFFFPVIFRQDPRYYRSGRGTTGARFGHALTHVFVAHGDSGGKMFNFSEWMGTAASSALSNTYHPGNRRGVGPASERIGFSIGTDMGFDVLREFWPEIIRKFKLPFRAPEQQPKPR
ncbi:MAG TPA: hypothetical protein VKQ89_07515 [Candidatus Angelobacter sp.]|nr:hypothetical protein [Candidatus Angelobacter sp.]